MANNKIKLSDYINVLSDFQYSINIEYDLYSDKKIQNYIPTMSAIDIIEDVMLSTSPNSNERARIFVGAYGKGKSHLALILLALLCRKDKRLYENLLNTICETKPELCKFIVDYQEGNQKLLPVVIQGSSTGVRQSFLLGIKKALQDNGLGEIMPSTYFSAAINTIQTWKEQYHETYSQFKESINCSSTEFVSELAQYNNAYYEKFLKLFPTLTSGSEFNPVNGMNIIELYNDVNEKIRKYGYTGIFVVYDEFSKFLSGNLKKTSSDEVEVLQYFAENCNRSGNKQMHIMLISHQSILNYVDKLPKSKVDAWKSVADRFKTVELNTSSSQMYAITARVIQKNETWFKDFQKMHKDNFENLYNKWKKSRIFCELTSDEIKNVIINCYPLEPVTTFLLPRISEKIAQNERTLFTFLSAEGQKYTLPQFLETPSKDDFPLVTPDQIYDYFERLFKEEAYDKPIHKFWKTASVALSKLEKSQKLEAKIIKTLALIYILDRVDLLPPDMETILSIYNGSVNDIQDVITALTNLTDRGILRKLENKNYLRIAEHTEQNIEAIINDSVEKIKTSSSAKNILNDFIGQKAIYPNAYNDDNEIVRYFDFEFVAAKDILYHDSDIEIIPESSAGTIYAVVTDSENYYDVLREIQLIQNERLIFVLTQNNENISKFIYQYQAIQNLLATSEDDILNEELKYSLTDIEEILQNYVDAFLIPELGEAQYFIGGELKQIKRRSSLSKTLSEICQRVFCNCPVINNEVINKDVISTQATNSRAKLVDGILANTIQHNLGLTGTGQEVSFMRSTLKMTEIYVEENDQVSLQLINLKDKNLEYVLSLIKEFMLSTTKNGITNFSALYNQLTNPEYHIGLKRGIIPVYIAVVLHFYKRYAVILKNGREIEINARLLEAINNSPDDYDLFLEQWDSEKEQYIQNLENIFAPFIHPAEKEYNNFEYIVHAIQRWYLQLPKYVKEIKHIYKGNGESAPADSSVIRLLNSLHTPEINARDFLFNKILWILDIKEFNLSIVQKIKKLKYDIDNIKPNLLETLAKDLIKEFGTSSMSKEATLSSVVLDWTEKLDETVKMHMFNCSENDLLRLCFDITPDYQKFIEDVARPATGLRIDDWGEITIDGCLRSVESFIKHVNEFDSNVKNSTSNSVAGSYKISFIDDDGAESYKTFDKTVLPENAQLLYNDIESMLTEEYGGSLTESEKRQVLIDIISKLLS